MSTKTQTCWDSVERRWSTDNKNLRCPVCQQWKDALLVKESDGGLCCWACIKADRRGSRNTGKQGS